MWLRPELMNTTVTSHYTSRVSSGGRRQWCWSWITS